MPFDPSKYGAVPVEESEFDPSKYGAIPVDESPVVRSEDRGNPIKNLVRGILDEIVAQPLGRVAATAGVKNKFKAIKSPIRAGGLLNPETGKLQNPFSLGGLRDTIGVGADIGLNVGTLTTRIGGSLGARVAKSAGLGGAFSANDSLKSGEIPSVGGLAAGIGLGGAVPVVGRGLSSITKAATEVLPKRLIQSAIGQSKKQLLGGKDVSDYVLKTKKVGTADKLIKDASFAVQNLGKQVQANLEAVPKTVRIYKNEIFKDVTKRINSEGGSITVGEVSQIVGNLAPQVKGLLKKQSLSLTEANRLRQALDKTIGDRGFLNSQLPFNKDILRSFDNALREKVKTLAPEGTREIFEELSKEITLRNSLLDKYAGQSRNQVVNAFDLILSGGGFLGGGAPGAIGAFAAKKAIQAPLTKTLLGVGLNRLNALGPILDKLTPAERVVILNLIGSFSGGKSSSQSNQ